jgi:hypothetical protein
MATYTAVAAGGNWNAVGTWGGGGYPVAGDTANIDATMTATVTVNAASACAVLNLTNNGGTLAFGNFVLTCTGNVTLGGTITAGTGGLTITGASTLTSGGVTFPGKLVLNYTGIVTLATNNWINTGLVTFSAATNLNKTTAETLTTNGGLTMDVASGTTPTATIIIGGSGGVWSGNNVLYNNLTFNCTTATVSGLVSYRTGIMTYTAGTITTTASTLNIIHGCTLNTNGIIWNNITTITNNETITLTSDLNMNGTLRFGNIAITFAGAYNISCATFAISYLTTTARTYTFVQGQTLTITTNFYISGVELATPTIKSSLGGTATNLIYQGTAANCKIFAATFTDVDASGSAQGIDNWYGGTLTNTTNITNRTSADIGGGTGGSTWFAGE